MGDADQHEFKGAYLVSGDENFGAVYVNDDSTVVLFASRDGKVDLSSQRYGSLDELSDDAGLRSVNNIAIKNSLK